MPTDADLTGAPLEEIAGQLLSARHLKLAVAESCTGGLVTDRLTNVPGSSAYFIGGVVAYAYEAKTAALGISAEFLLQYGAVSPETALAMARGVRQLYQTDVAISVTGIAGPGGGLPNKPVGLTYVALVAADREIARRYVWTGDRLQNKMASADAALRLLIEYLL
jgi:PncC family amidohydrolase